MGSSSLYRSATKIRDDILSRLGLAARILSHETATLPYKLYF